MTKKHKKKRLAKLPSLIAKKIYKTGQTRGADDDVIFQNRVNRNSTVLIPYANYDLCCKKFDINKTFENGFIVLIDPISFFSISNFEKEMLSKYLVLGENALLFYETRDQWNRFNPIDRKLTIAQSRVNPLGGHFVSRVPSTTSNDDIKINHGFTTSKSKGAGIRVYEYASASTIKECMLQLEYLYWLCYDSREVSLENGMSLDEINEKYEATIEKINKLNLGDIKRLKESRVIDRDNNTICPLCLDKLSTRGFYSKLEQAEGRHVPDLTVTQLNLFHIIELRTGELNHKPYNLGWGHHHCNVVTKDAGIIETLKWMIEVVDRNESNGYKIR